MTTRILAEIQPGDIIDGFFSNPDTLVTHVEPGEPLTDGTPMVRYRGRMGRRMAHKVKGDPRHQEFQKKEHTWCFRADQYFEVVDHGCVRL